MTPSTRRGWSDLPPDERRALATLLVLVPALHVAIKVSGYPRVRAWIDRASRPREDRTDESTAAMLENAYGLASRRLAARPWWPGNCLSRSLAVLWRLRRHGIDAMLRLGVHRSDGGLDAHAWIEIDGRVINDRNDVSDRFAPLNPQAPLSRPE